MGGLPTGPTRGTSRETNFPWCGTKNARNIVHARLFWMYCSHMKGTKQRCLPTASIGEICGSAMAQERPCFHSASSPASMQCHSKGKGLSVFLLNEDFSHQDPYHVMHTDRPAQSMLTRDLSTRNVSPGVVPAHWGSTPCSSSASHRANRASEETGHSKQRRGAYVTPIVSCVMLPRVLGLRG